MAEGRNHGGFSTLLLLAGANLLNYANRNVAFHHSVYSDLRSMFSVDEAALGLLGTAFMFSHAAVTLPVGWLGDRLPRNRVIAAGVFLWSISAIWGAFANSYTSLLASRFVAGIGCAACVPIANAALCDIYAGPKKARMMSIFNVGLFLGGVVGFGAGGLLGFVNGFLLVGVPGLLLALLVVRHPINASSVAVENAASLKVFVTQIRMAFRGGALRWMYAGAVLMAFSAGGYIAWFSEFLEGSKGMAEAEAGVLFGLCLLGGLLGVVAGGMISDRLSKSFTAGKQICVALGVGLAVPCALFALWLPKSTTFYIVSFLLMFFISWYHAPIAAAVDDLVPEERAATTQGVYIFLMHLLGTAPSSYVVGVLASRLELTEALLLPTATMACAAVLFAVSAVKMSGNSVVQPRV